MLYTYVTCINNPTVGEADTNKLCIDSQQLGITCRTTHHTVYCVLTLWNIY